MPKPKVPGELPQGVFAAVGKFLKFAPNPISPGLRSNLAKFARAAGGGRRPRVPNAAQDAGRRAAQLQDQIPNPKTRSKVTMGVGIGTDSTGSRRTLVSSSEPGPPRRGVEIREDETFIRQEYDGPRRHAEENIIKYAEDNDIQVDGVGAGRRICFERCQGPIAQHGAEFGTELRPPMKGR